MPKSLLPIFIIAMFIAVAVAQNIVKYEIVDDGTELDIGTAVKVNAVGNILACGDNDPDVIGVITGKESDGINRYYLVSSSDIAVAPLPNTVIVGEKLTTAAAGGIRDASLGEMIIGIALENGDGNPLTLEKLILTLGFASPQNFIANQYASAQSANFWISGNGQLGDLIVNNSSVINASGGNYDFRVEGDTDPNLLFTDASADRIGIGTNAPQYKLDVSGSVAISGGIYDGASTGSTNQVLTADGLGGLSWEDRNLQQAYNGSGSGAGRIIAADNGPVQLDVSGAQSRLRMVERAVPGSPADGDIEIFDTNLGPLIFYYDGGRGKWLSSAVFMDGAGRNGNLAAGNYLRGFDGLPLSDLVGHILPDDACFVAVALSCKFVSTCTGILRANGVDLAGTSVSLAAETRNGIADINVDANWGDIISPYCSAGTMRSPQMHYWYRIRR